MQLKENLFQNKGFFTDYKKVLIITLLLTFIYELILSFQGFDLCDEGDALTFYRQIFKCPSSIEFQLPRYLGGVVGGVWNIVFGFGGIFSFRILTILALLLTIYFTSESLKKIIHPLMIPVATSLVLLMNNYGIMVFFHDHLTALLAAIATYFLLKGLNLNRPKYLFAAAMFCGINIFARIPNVTLLALGLLLFIDYSYNKNKRWLGRNILVSIAGLAAGTGIVILIMFLLGHTQLFFQTVFSNLLSNGTSGNGPHNFRGLINIYLINYHHILIYLAIFVFVLTFFTFNYRFYTQKWKKAIVIISYSILIIVFSLYAFNCEKYYAIILFPLIISCYADRKSKAIILLNAASLIVMFFMPLGSDAGVLNMGYYSVWLPTFAAAAHVYRFIQYKIQKDDNSYRVFFLAFYVLYCVYGLYVVSRNAYYDRGARWEKLYRADNDKFTVFTTKEKAQAMNVLLSELGKYVHKGDYLFCFESLPMIHYLTETKPYTGNPWVWGYDANNFIRHLKKSVETIPLPVVLRQKCQPMAEGYWTVPYISPQGTPLATNEKKLAFFEKFLDGNGYTIAWENDLFQIYIPPNLLSQ